MYWVEPNEVAILDCSSLLKWQFHIFQLNSCHLLGWVKLCEGRGGEGVRTLFWDMKGYQIGSCMYMSGVVQQARPPSER